MSDLRGYQIKTKQQEVLEVLYNPFNIKAESLILSDFSLEDIKNLYRQHTQETGQVFTDEAIAYAFTQTQGQPWLVNALAYLACFQDVQGESIPITREVLEKARESLIKRCDTNIEDLLDKLNDPRVIDIMDILFCKGRPCFSRKDLQYVQNLGLIAKQGLSIANPIYQEIIPRLLEIKKNDCYIIR